MYLHRLLAERLISAHAARAVDVEALAQALSGFASAEHPDDTVLLEQGAASDELLVLVDGEVAVTADDRLVARIPGPAIVGHLGVLAGLGRSATVTATGPVEVRTLGRDAMWRLVDSDDPAGTALRRLLLAAMAGLLVAENSAISEVPGGESDPGDAPAPAPKSPGPAGPAGPAGQSKPFGSDWGFDEDLLRQADEVRFVEDEASKRRNRDG